jgi:hypothetical protein
VKKPISVKNFISVPVHSQNDRTHGPSAGGPAQPSITISRLSKLKEKLDSFIRVNMEENLARLHVYYDEVASPGSAAPLHDRVMACKVRTLRCSFSNSRSELKFFSGPKNWSCGFPTINLSNTVFLKEWRLSRCSGERGAC